MSKKPKTPRSFGHGFDLLLRHVEKWEDYYQGRTKKIGPEFAFNTDLFHIRSTEEFETEHLRYAVDMAENAHRLRNSFKFKCDWDSQAAGISEDIADEAMNTPLSPPFEQCVFLAENWAPGADLIMLIDTRTADHIDDTAEMVGAYSDHGILSGDQFISVMPCMYRREGCRDDQDGSRMSQKLGFWPIEIHYRMHGTLAEGDHGLGATPHFAVPTERWRGSNTGKADDTQMALSSTLYFMFWLLSKSETRRVPGLTARNQGMKKPKGRKVFYEHHVVDIDPFAVKQISGVASGLHRGSPRFHAVRGFWRHYKQPIKTGPHAGKTQVWIEPQWRGDKEKGVITKDYNIVRTHG